MPKATRGQRKKGREWKVCEELKGELFFFLNAEGNLGTKEKRGRQPADEKKWRQWKV